MLHRFRMAIAIFTIAPSAFAASTPQGADPSISSAPAENFHYRSVLDSYQPAAEIESPNKAWREANEEVGRIGGHAGYMKAGNRVAPAAHEVQGAPRAALPETGSHSGHHGMHH